MCSGFSGGTRDRVGRGLRCDSSSGTDSRNRPRTAPRRGKASVPGGAVGDVRSGVGEAGGRLRIGEGAAAVRADPHSIWPGRHDA